MVANNGTPTSISPPRRAYVFDAFRLEVASRRLWHEEGLVKLTGKTFEILLFLVERAGQVVSREEILQNIWSDHFVEDGNLTVHIAALRKQLGDTHSEPRMIATVPRQGYSFVAPVTEAAEIPAPVNGANGTEQSPTSPTISIAVLPFTVVGENGELDYLADGIMESLITALSRQPRLKVLATSAVLGYRNHLGDPCQIGRELGIQNVLAGRVRCVGDELSIVVELIRVEDNAELWGGQYHQAFADIFAAQDNIARQIIERLLPRLTEAEKDLSESRQTKSSEAYRTYLKGRRLLSQLTTGSIHKALNYFEEAVRIDPDYALAHVRIGLTCYYLNDYKQIPYQTALTRIHSSIDRAFEIDPHLSEAHTLRGICKMVYEWDRQTAESELQLGVELNPNSVFARSAFANALKIYKRFDEARHQLQKVFEIDDPFALSANTIMGGLLYNERRFEEAVVHLQELIELHPTSLLGHIIMSICFQQLGDYRAGLAKMRKAYSLDPSLDVAAYLGEALARAGKTEEATSILQRIENSFEHKPSQTFYFYLALGQIDDAFNFLNESLARREVGHLFLYADPRSDQVRSDPRFIAVLKQMNLSD